MMGPTRIPVIHNRAFGHVTMFPAAAPRGARMGEPPGPTGDTTTIEYQKDLAYYEAIRSNFEQLVALIGDAAETVLAQAKAAYEKSLRTWTASQPARF